MDLNKLTLGDKIVAGCGIVLLLFIFFLDWHSAFGFGIGALSGDGEAVAFPAFIALLILLAVLAVVLLRKLTTTDLPEVPMGWNNAIFYGCIAILALLLLKLIMKYEFISFGAYLMILLAAGMVYGGFLISKESETATGTGGTAPPTPF